MNVHMSLIFIHVGLVSALSFVGLILSLAHRRTIDRILPYLMSLAAGGMIAQTCFHALPEIVAFARPFSFTSSLFLLLGFIAFFIIALVLHTHQNVSSTGLLNIFGDTLHNFIDGVSIASAFLVSPALGTSTTLAIFLHEIPKEFVDFAILLHSGFSVRAALLLNMLSASAAFAGALTALLAAAYIPNITQVLIPITAGGFIYIGASSLLPEVMSAHITNARSKLLHLFAFGAGTVLMTLL